jgi:Lon protease-like protein
MNSEFKTTETPLDKKTLKDFIKHYSEHMANEMDADKVAMLSNTWASLETAYMMYESQEQLNKSTKELKNSSDKLNILTLILAILTAILVIDTLLTAFHIIN